MLVPYNSACRFTLLFRTVENMNRMVRARNREAFHVTNDAESGSRRYSYAAKLSPHNKVCVGG